MAEETKTLKKPARYISRFLKLRIVRKAGYSREVDGQRVSTPGTSIQFDGGVFETTDPEEVAFIEGRPEFGTHIQKVPDNVEALAAQDKAFKNLEEKEKEIAEREAAVAAKEAALTDTESGKADGEDDEESDDGLEELSKAELLEIVEKEEVEGVNSRTKVEDLIAAIRTARADQAAFTD